MLGRLRVLGTMERGWLYSLRWHQESESSQKNDKMHHYLPILSNAKRLVLPAASAQWVMDFLHSFGTPDDRGKWVTSDRTTYPIRTNFSNR